MVTKKHARDLDENLPHWLNRKFHIASDKSFAGRTLSRGVQSDIEDVKTEDSLHTSITLQVGSKGVSKAAPNSEAP